jgi:hypothetical protein
MLVVDHYAIILVVIIGHHYIIRQEYNLMSSKGFHLVVLSGTIVTQEGAIFVTLQASR